MVRRCGAWCWPYSSFSRSPSGPLGVAKRALRYLHQVEPKRLPGFLIDTSFVTMIHLMPPSVIWESKEVGQSRSEPSAVFLTDRDDLC
jgi:hypothetical protein